MALFIFLKSPDKLKDNELLQIQAPDVFDPNQLQNAARNDHEEEVRKRGAEGLQIDSLRAQLQDTSKSAEDIKALDADQSCPDGSVLLEKVLRLAPSPEKTERVKKILEWMIQTARGKPIKIMKLAFQALNEGMLSEKELGDLESKSNLFPPIVFLREVQKDSDLASKIEKMDEQGFSHFYWSNVITHQAVIDRTEKALADNQIDHDHLGFIAPSISS